MQVISVNLSQPRDIRFQGQTHRTGIFKQAFPGPLEVTTTGCKDDTVIDLVNHGGEHKAVYAFGLSHYAHWQQVLGRDELQPGAFGENLSLSELDEELVHIGDRFRAGSALLEVSQPRVPCFKLGAALEDERAPALFTMHFHTGAYFRVIEPGAIAVGDLLQSMSRHPSSMSVYTLFRANFDRKLPRRRDILTEAAEIDELAPPWKLMIQKSLG